MIDSHIIDDQVQVISYSQNLSNLTLVFPDEGGNILRLKRIMRKEKSLKYMFSHSRESYLGHSQIELLSTDEKVNIKVMAKHINRELHFQTKLLDIKVFFPKCVSCFVSVYLINIFVEWKMFFVVSCPIFVARTDNGIC